MMHARMGGKEADRVVDAHREHIADARFPPRHGERLGIEAPSAAYVTQHLDVGEEAHLDGLHALACARLAAPAGGVEREAARGVAADARLGGAGVDAADVVPEADVGRGTGARGLADRCLIYLEHPVDVLEPAHGRTADELRGGSAPRPSARGSRLPEQPLQVRVQDVARHGGLARTRYAGNHYQTSERDAYVASADVVHRYPFERMERRGGIHGAMRPLGMQQRLAEEPSGGRARVSHEIGHGPRPDELAAAH